MRKFYFETVTNWGAKRWLDLLSNKVGCHCLWKNQNLIMKQLSPITESNLTN